MKILKDFKRGFEDYYEYDEFEDEIGEGEFGVVYKCRRIREYDAKDDDDDDSDIDVGMGDIEFKLESHNNNDNNNDNNSDIGNNTVDSYANFNDTQSDTGDSYGNNDTQSDTGADTDQSNSVTVGPGGDSGTDSDSFGGNNRNTNKFNKSKKDKKLYAVKVIKKAKFHRLGYEERKKTLETLRQEIYLLEKISKQKSKHKETGSEYIIDLVDIFEDRNYLYIVTNYCSGGNLWQNVERNERNNYGNSINIESEQDIQLVMKQILQGLLYLHDNNIAHLDLKPDNIVFTSRDINRKVQIIDFGMSRYIILYYIMWICIFYYNTE